MSLNKAMNTEGIQILGMNISGWIYAPLPFVVWLVAGYSAKGFFFSALEK